MWPHSNDGCVLTSPLTASMSWFTGWQVNTFYKRSGRNNQDEHVTSMTHTFSAFIWNSPMISCWGLYYQLWSDKFWGVYGEWTDHSRFNSIFQGCFSTFFSFPPHFSHLLTSLLLLPLLMPVITSAVADQRTFSHRIHINQFPVAVWLNYAAWTCYCQNNRPHRSRNGTFKALVIVSSLYRRNIRVHWKRPLWSRGTRLQICLEHNQ